MATRPVFMPGMQGQPLVVIRPVEFKWFPGLFPSQKQKSVDSLHASAASEQIAPVLEVSSKSRTSLGQSLSAFRLALKLGASEIPVECVFQSGKVFERGGPYLDLRGIPPRDARRDLRLKNSGRLVGFVDDQGKDWPTEPLTAFYDWLYLRALNRRPDLMRELGGYQGFTDIEFNPGKSINCQAKSCALFVALSRRDLLNDALSSKDAFIKALRTAVRDSGGGQQTLF